jgi:hypothetical protein
MQLQKAKAFRLDLVEKCVSDEEIRLRGEMLTLCLNSPTNCMRDKTGAPCISLDPQGVVNLLSQYGTATSKRCHSLGPLFLLDNNLDWPSLFLISFDRRSEQGLDVPFHCLPLTTVKVTGLDHHAGKWG